MTRWLSRVTDVSTGWRAGCWYILITMVMTWPLTPNIARDVPGDLGDPLFICWGIARAADHWLALLSGDFGAAIRFWHAEQLHPDPFITVYSEHFAAHGLQILPLWVLTGNILLCYNVLFLASFVLSAIGMYLLARELTGSPRAAFVAGLMLAFTPYRFATMSHLQVLSAQWMPLALFGLRRYIVTGRRAALAGGAAALLLQNLSSGYYTIFFGPFAVAYALVEMGACGMLARWRVWRDLAIAGLATLVLTLPFALPYAVLQRRYQYRRSLSEVMSLSADLLGWITTAPKMNVWGWMDTWPRPEGFLFPGFFIVVLAVAGVAISWRRADDEVDSGRTDAIPTPRAARAVATYALIATVIAMWMAMGPAPTVADRPLPIPSLYMVFYEYVPGFNVARVASRFTTVIVLCLAMAAAYGLASLDRPRRRIVLLLVGLGVLLDGAALPLERNRMFATSAETVPPDPRVYPYTEAPPLWRYLETLPAEAVLAHLPFGYPEHELRYLYYSRVDRHRLSNGYSGAFPVSYVARSPVLRRAAIAPEQAVQRLRDDEVNYVIVHTHLWPGDVGMRTVAALEGAGLRPVTRIGTVYVLEVPRDRHP